jgi:HSP20 family protein
MSSGEKRESRRINEEESTAITPRRFENFFDNFRHDMERMMRPWSMPMGWDISPFFEARESRIALYDLIDKDDRYELQVEVPGIDKEKIDVKATKYSVEISGKHMEKTEDKGKRYLYSERVYRSFYRNIPIPEEIVPSKVNARVENGILKLELPKKVPTRREDETHVEVK